MAKKSNARQKKKNGVSVQELLGIKALTEYGIQTNRGELLFFKVRPTNISVLSQPSVETKIRQLTLVLSAVPDVEISCTDSAECFDENKAYLMSGRKKRRTRKFVRSLSGTLHSWTRFRQRWRQPGNFCLSRGAGI